MWAQLRADDGSWRHPAAEALLCRVLVCPKLTPRAQRSFLDVSKTGGALRVRDDLFELHVGSNAHLRQLASGLHALPTLRRCAFTVVSAPKLSAALLELLS